MTRVLVVDDDPAILRTLRINLQAREYDVQIARDGRSALQWVQEEVPDLVILDLGLPDVDGVNVLRRIRVTSEVPVIVLSARHDSDDKVEALDAGADDYVTKPFGMDELLARLRAALRRNPVDRALGLGSSVIATPDFTLDFGACRAERAGAEVRLTPTEWRLLATLARTPGQLVHQVDLLRGAWGPSYGRESNYLRVYANQLRRKLEPDPSQPRYLITEPGIGYRLDV